MKAGELYERVLMTVLVAIGFVMVGTIAGGALFAVSLAVRHSPWLGGAITVGLAALVGASWRLAGKSQ